MDRRRKFEIRITKFETNTKLEIRRFETDGRTGTIRALLLIEQHYLANSLTLADALIAATALEHGLDLITGNDKHYRAIDGLELVVFRP